MLGGLAMQAAASAAPANRVEVRGEWLYVDDEPFLVKGVGYSPFRPGQLPWKSQVSLEVMAKDFDAIRRAGFNTIRTWTPLHAEQLRLARQHGLMVVQGIWVDPKGNYTSEAFQALVLKTVAEEAARVKGHENVLALLVGNELLPERVLLAGLDQTRDLLALSYRAAKQAHGSLVVSYANWPRLSALDVSFLDVVGFNLYPYEPRSISHSLGFRGYVEHLKRTVARSKPLLITELGLSVSPKPGSRPGYGGHSLDSQAREVLKLWDAAFQAGAQGACVFEWNDEWWKQAEHIGDEQTHDEEDPEEWFGITAFPPSALPAVASPEALTAAARLAAQPRPVYEALRSYNQAIMISPISGESYQERLPVSVYTTDAVARLRVRVESRKWVETTQTTPHWWKASVPIPKAKRPRQLRVVMEARDAQGRVVSRHERTVWTLLPMAGGTLGIRTDQDRYRVGARPQRMTFTISLTDPDGRAIAGQRVDYAVEESHVGHEIVQSGTTNAQGAIEGAYLLGETGLVMISAGTSLDAKRPDRRLGDEHAVVIEAKEERQPEVLLSHQPSVWEARASDDIRRMLSHPSPSFRLYDSGTEPVVDYSRYGRFEGAGTAQYHYDILDQEGLAAAAGEGVYPNEHSLLRDPAFRKTVQENRLDGSVWDFTHHADAQLGFFKWASNSDEPLGVRQFYVAQILEQAGLLQQAAKAHYAIVVHFPKAIGWTEFKTPWYVGRAALDRLRAVLRLHPELGLRLEGTKIRVERGFDNDIENDVISVDPGRLVRVEPAATTPAAVDVSALPVEREIGRAPSGARHSLAGEDGTGSVGKGRVRLRQYENGHWQLVVEGKPWVIRGLSYQPSAVGESPDEGTLKDWMLTDRNNNGKIDGPFETFVDSNGNNRQDAEEPTVGDARLLADMGVNTLRLYHHASNKKLLRQLHDEHGFMVLMGDLVGMYTIGSGATWEEGTNYLDPVQRKRMTDSVRRMVREFKKEPYILMWMLGNENNYGGQHGIVGGQGNAGQYPKEYYAFLNELAEWIHKEDPDHPVAIANGEVMFLDIMAQQAPAIDVFGANVYRGWQGAGESFFEAVRRTLDKPAFLSEFGCPAYQADRPREEGELGQAFYHFGNWVDLEANMAGRGVGNALGGVIFEWADEWWKAGQPPRFSPRVQETAPNWSGPFPGGRMYEEWMGLVSQGDGNTSPWLRQLRAAYRMYRQLWNPAPLSEGVRK